MRLTLEIGHRIFNLGKKNFIINRRAGQELASVLNRMPRTGFDYESQVNGRQSAIIMACVRWIQRTYPEAPLQLKKYNKDSWEKVQSHPLIDLLNSPNQYYDGLLMQSALVADFALSGNAYLRKIRSGAGRPVELWWIPSTMIEPRWPWDNSEYLTHYEYYPGGASVKIAPSDIVHFRDGLDPNNTRKGISALQSLFREVFTDDEAANMTATLLKNLGVPGLVISPESEIASDEDAKEIKKWFKENTTGDKRGEPLVISTPTKVDMFGFSPQQMDLKQLRRIPEERISGVLGIPAIVAGLGAGLDRSTFANFAEAREMAYESNIIPLQRLLTEALKRQLLIDFEDDMNLWRIGYDLSEVRVLQEDENKLTERTVRQVLSGTIKIKDAQRIMGLPVDETQDIYLRPFNVLEVRSGVLEDSKANHGHEHKMMSAWPEDRKDAYWKNYAQRTEGKERVFMKTLRSLWNEQEAEVIKNLESHPTLEGTDFDTIKAEEAFNENLQPIISEIYAEAMMQVHEELDQHAGHDHEVKQEELLNQVALNWISTRSLELAKLLNGTTKEQLREALIEGFRNGESIPKIAKRIEEFYGKTYKTRALMIARTETITASNRGAEQAYQELGVKNLQWYTALDERVCPECAPLHGNIYPINQGPRPAIHPQCRCVMISAD